MPGSVRLVYRFAADVRSASREGNRITLDVENWKPLAFTAAKTEHADAVMALHDGGATLGRLAQIAGAAPDGTKTASYYVERFARARLLAWSLEDDEGELGQVNTLANSYRPREDDPPSNALALCRFAYLRRLDSGAVLESGRVPVRLALNVRGLAAFAGALTPSAATNRFASVMWRLGFFDEAARQESEAERCWEFPDLVLHEASRFNRDATPIGGTYRFDGKFPAPPAIKPAMAGERIALPPVDAARLRQMSGALDAVQSGRRSIRAYAAEPISLPALGEFLWRVCRTTQHLDIARQDLISRPYPAGGSINELEFYLAIRRCEGLEPAIYNYDSHRHELVRLAGSDKIATRIVTRSGGAMGLDANAQLPDLTIVIASRLPRLAWKYQGMAYRASLMNAGVVFELMYLVATDMKLAPCANGSGDSRLLQEATGIDPFEETAIAEFCLGVPAEG
ncbi:MAG: SagB/ThcOx family dehydrogenase [Alphaproteobacteria bacterium]|nr:SagB/ThcOx family dehydrogenase [Alphaproteobacteria bacterium]